ncbi:MAG: COP23 domain-containing protein [Cyanobacteria bacterium P01_G01_bin.49]
MKKQTSTKLNALIKGTSLTLGIAILLHQSGVNANPLYQFIKGYDIAQQYPGDIIIDDNINDNPQNPTATPVNTGSSDTRFDCQINEGQYKVMYIPQSQGNQPYPWAIPSNLGDGWTAERRCNEISRRLEMYRPDGLLELRTGRENNYDTICVTTEANSSCRIVLTVPPGKNPEITRDQIFQTLVSAENGQYTQGVNAFRGNGNILNDTLGQLFNGKKPSQSRSNPINLRPFLDPVDGGTGAKLEKTPTNSNPNPSTPSQSNPSPSNSRTLNPDLFR